MAASGRLRRDIMAARTTPSSLNCILHGAMLKIILVIFIALLPLEVTGRDDGRYGQVAPETKAWVEGLANGLGHSCCSTADGFRPEKADWDSGKNGYRVRIDGYWHNVPDYALIKERNRLGVAIVWFIREGESPGNILIMCFLPGSEG
jgi:hypothetical protein